MSLFADLLVKERRDSEPVLLVQAGFPVAFHHSQN